MPAPLLSRAVDHVLQIMALTPDRPFFQRELERLTGEPYNGVVQALDRLVREDVARTVEIGGKRGFVINRQNPYFEEFQRIALKSLGIPEALDAAGVVVLKVALFGSFARGQAGPGSDLDLLVVGAESQPGAASAALSPLSARIGHPINVQVYDHATYLAEWELGTSFITALINGPLINLRGEL
jgi:predicted nucleotidyltransferase